MKVRGVVRAVVALAAVVLAGCYDGGFTHPAPEAPPTATSTIAALQAMAIDAPVDVDAAISVTGRVTTTDEAGNFYRTLLIEEDGAALELMAGERYLDRSFPEGCRVTLNLNGLTLTRTRGVLQAGVKADPSGGYDVDYLPSRAALDRHLTRHDESLQPIEPLCVAIPELRPEMCGRLVRVEHIAYTPEPNIPVVQGWCGERRFTDREGNEIYTFVREYARFAYTLWPESGIEGSITGILQLQNGHFSIKPRDERDIF